MTTPARADSHPQQTTAAPRVLLVDPFDVFWPVTVELLRWEGMTVRPVADGREALQVARAELFTVALVELATGCRGGWHALQVAGRLLEMRPPPRVLFVSAAMASRGEEILFNFQRIPVVQKGDPQALVAAIRGAHRDYLGLDQDEDEDGEE